MAEFIADPNDPKLKTQNELRTLVAMLEISASETSRQIAVSEENLKILMQLLKEEEESRRIKFDDKKKEALPEEEEIKKIKEKIVEVKDSIIKLLEDTRKEAHKAVEEYFGNDPKNTDVKKIANELVDTVFTEKTIKESAVITEQLAKGELTKEDALKGAHPIMRDMVGAQFDAAQKATKDGNIPNTAQKGISLGMLMKWAQEMKAKLTQKIAITTGPLTSEQQKSVEQVESNALTISQGEKITVSYADKNGKLAQADVSKDTELGKYIYQEAAAEDEMGLGKLFDQEYIDPKKLEKLSEEKSDELAKRLNKQVEELDGQSVGAKLEKKAEQLRDFYQAKMAPIVENLATKVVEKVSGFFSSLRSALKPEPKPSAVKEEDKKEAEKKKAETQSFSITQATGPTPKPPAQTNEEKEALKPKAPRPSL